MDSFDKKFIFWTLGIFTLFAIGVAMQEQIGSQLTRGLRLNNPGNIRRGASWAGMTADQPDSAFVKFSDARYGFRAMAHIWRAYRTRGIVTIRQIVSTWAPSSENNTAAYISVVVKSMDVYPDYVITDSDFLALAKAIVKQEQGLNPYSDATIVEGLNL